MPAHNNRSTRRVLRALLAGAAAFLIASAACAAIAPTVCHGKLFNPITDTNWNDFFPQIVDGPIVCQASPSLARRAMNFASSRLSTWKGV